MKLLKLLAPMLFLFLLTGLLWAKEPSYKLFELENGMKVLIKTAKASSIVSAGIWVRAGGINENTGEEGFCQLIEKMTYTGTAAYPKNKALEEIAKMGAQKSALAGSDYTYYSVLGPSDRLEALLEIQFDAVFNLELNTTILAEKTNELINEITQRSARSDIRVEEELLKTTFNSRGYGTPSSEAAANLKSVDLKKVEAFYKRHYTAENACVVIVGNVEAEKALTIVKRLANTVSQTPCSCFVNYNAPKHKKALTKIVYEDVQRSYVRMGFLTPDGKSPDRFALTAAAKMLGGENGMLNKTLVKQLKLGMSAGAVYYSSRLPMLFEIGGVTTPGLAERFVKKARQVVGRLKTGDFSIDELTRAKQQIIADEVFASENPEKRAANYGHALMLGGIGETEDFSERILNLTASDIQSAAEKYFIESGLTIVRLEPKPDSEDSMPQMHTLENKVRLILKANHSSPSVAVSVKVMAGGLLEGYGEAGLAKAAAAMLLNADKTIGEQTLGEIAAQMGTRLSFDVYKSYAVFNMQCLSEHFFESFNLFMSCLLEPDFSQRAFEGVKEQLLLEAETKAEGQSIIECAKDSALNALFADTQLAYPEGGRKKDIKALSLSDVKSFYRKYYVGANIAAAIVGDIYINESKSRLINAFARFKIGKPDMPDSFKLKKKVKPVELEVKKNLASGCIVYLSRTVAKASDKESALNLACMILAKIPSSRLNSLSQKMPSAEFNAELKSLFNEGYFCASAMAPAAELASAAQALKAEIELAKEKGFTNEEFETAKKYAAGRYALTLKDNMALADNFSSAELMGLGFDWFKNYPEFLKTITKEQAEGAMREYVLANESYVTAAARP